MEWTPLVYLSIERLEVHIMNDFCYNSRIT